MIRILVACESSGVVRDAFNAIGGVYAVSCDLLPSDDGDKTQHFQCDVRTILDRDWDLMIAHPPCTHLSVSGARYFEEKRKDGRQQKAIDFFMELVNAPIPRIVIENPVGIMSSLHQKPQQIIQPWMFGDDASKATCLWMKNIPALKHEKIIPPHGYKLVKYAGQLPLCPDCKEESYCDEHQCHFADCDCIGPTQDDVFYRKINGYLFGTKIEGLKPVWSNQTPSGQNKLGPSPDRWKLRSKTYAGVASAMANQWMSYLSKENKK